MTVYSIFGTLSLWRSSYFEHAMIHMGIFSCDTGHSKIINFSVSTRKNSYLFQFSRKVNFSKAVVVAVALISG